MKTLEPLVVSLNNNLRGLLYWWRSESGSFFRTVRRPSIFRTLSLGINFH